MYPIVPVADLAREVGGLDEAETVRAEGFLTEASDLAREIGRPTWTDAGGSNPAPASVRLIVKAAAKRALNEDPDGYGREVLGDWQGTPRANAMIDETGVYFTKGERLRIRTAARKPSGATSIATPSGWEREATADLVLPVLGAKPLPYLDAED